MIGNIFNSFFAPPLFFESKRKVVLKKHCKKLLMKEIDYKIH